MARTNRFWPLQNLEEEDAGSNDHPGVTPRTATILNKGPESRPLHQHKRRRSSLHNGDAPSVDKLYRTDSVGDTQTEKIKGKHQHYESFKFPEPPSASSSTSASDDGDEKYDALSYPAQASASPGGYKRTPDSIRVQPPLYNRRMKPTWQWASNMYHSSRPKIPFGWCKRWRCGDCMAETIMEQRVCSRLTCTHKRCINCVAHCLVLPTPVMADKCIIGSAFIDEHDEWEG